MSGDRFSTVRRPMGVWIMTAGNILFAGLASVQVFDVILHPGANWNESVRITAPYLLGVILLIQILAVGAWAGSTRARNTMIVFLGLLAAQMMAKSVASAIRLMESAPGDLPMSQLWNLLDGPAWALWLALNYWYFFRSRARSFYSS
jgi:hypothetical protein